VGGEGSARAAAFSRLADEHLAKAYHLARAILRDEAEAQDATHDAFVQAWRKWETLRDAARFEQWFDRILVNACRLRLRGRGRQATDISTEVALATGDHAPRADDQTMLRAAIATLSPDHQVVVALRYYRDLQVDGKTEYTLTEATCEGGGPFWGNHAFHTGGSGLAFGGDTTAGVRGGVPRRFYVWASVIQDGRVVATDYAPDAGWLVPSANAKP